MKEKAALVTSAIAHRATWTGLTYKYGVEAGKAKETEALIRQAISETGRITGEAIKGRIENAEDFNCFLGEFANPVMQEVFQLKPTKLTDEVLNLEFSNCPLLNRWRELGFDDEMCAKLCDMAMDGDRNVAKVMGYDFYLGDTLAKGCPICHVRFSKKK